MTDGTTSNLTFYDAGENKYRRLKFAVQDFCILTEIVGTIFARVGGKHTYRSILDALIGIFKGRLDWENQIAPWFTASHETLADQVKEFDHSMAAGDKKNQLQVIKRSIKNLMESQEADGLNLIEYQQGSRGGVLSEPKSSKFRLKIIEYAMEAYYRASVNPKQYENKGPGSRWYHAAIEVADEIPRKKQSKEKPKRAQSYDQKTRQAVGTMTSLGQDILQNGGDYESVMAQFKSITITSLGEVTAQQIGVDPLEAASPEGHDEAAALFGKLYDEFCIDDRSDFDDKSYTQ